MAASSSSQPAEPYAVAADNRSHVVPPAEAASPVCRICGKGEWVGCWWPERPEDAICITCCEAGAEHHDGEVGHVWEYDRGERDKLCIHCGQAARNTDRYDHWEP